MFHLELNKIFANPHKKVAGQAQKIKTAHKNPNSQRAFLSKAEVQKAENLIENGCEFFAKQLWKVKLFLGQRGPKYGGKFVNKYDSFFCRRLAFKKTLTALSIALSWMKKYRSWPIESLKDHVTLTLARQSMPFSIKLISSMKLKEVTHFTNGLLQVEHRKLLDSSLPSHSIVLSPESALATAIARASMKLTTSRRPACTPPS